MGSARNADLVLPLNVTLEELCRGATRRVRLNQTQLRRAGRRVLQDAFEVHIPKGATDGDKITLPCGQSLTTELTSVEDHPGNVSFVLQELRHPHWRRKGLDLYVDRSITLLEALTGFFFVIEHPDGRRLPVSSRPGEIVRPRSILLDPKAEWERHEHTDAFAGEDAGFLKTGDLEACKDVCRKCGYSGFTYWEDTAYFRSHSRGELLVAMRRSKGSTLFICPDPEHYAPLRMQRAIRGAGLSSLDDPSVKGNLFVLLRVDFPKSVDDDKAALLQEALPHGQCGQKSIPRECEGGYQPEEFTLCDLSPAESQRQHHIATGGGRVSSSAAPDRDEAPPAGSPGPPPCRQM